MAIEAILFDLFGTVVHFDTSVPTVVAGGERRRTTLGWLEPTIAESLPNVRFSDFLEAIQAVTREIVADRPPEYLEVRSDERFRRALRRAGVAAAEADRTCRHLSEVHMAHIASKTVLPDGHAELLAAISRRTRIGLVSNFDHGPTARRILAMHGIDGAFASVTISDGFGRRKPHPVILLPAAASVGAQPERCWFVGDSYEDDVVGARRAGMKVAWLRGGDPTGPLLPDLEIESLAELERLLD